MYKTLGSSQHCKNKTILIVRRFAEVTKMCESSCMPNSPARVLGIFDYIIEMLLKPSLGPAIGLRG